MNEDEGGKLVKTVEKYESVDLLDGPVLYGEKELRMKVKAQHGGSIGWVVLKNGEGKMLFSTGDRGRSGGKWQQVKGSDKREQSKGTHVRPQGKGGVRRDFDKGSGKVMQAKGKGKQGLVHPARRPVLGQVRTSFGQGRSKGSRKGVNNSRPIGLNRSRQ